MQSSVQQVFLVGLGGFVGSSLRFVVAGWVQRLAPGGDFPWGTLAVNVLGCLLLGFLGGAAELAGVLTVPQRLFLMIGLLGGFTTFSTFAYETFALARGAEVLKAFANVVSQVTLGFGAAWLGFLGARFL